jgi:Holliday junction resolvase RusA-like endonuclease
MSAFTIELPLPPTANNAYPTNGKTGRRYLSKRAREWQNEAGWILAIGHAPRMAGPYRFSLRIPENARGDADGYLKLPIDLMVTSGVTIDDKNAVAVSSTRDPAVRPRRCVVWIESEA